MIEQPYILSNGIMAKLQKSNSNLKLANNINSTDNPTNNINSSDNPTNSYHTAINNNSTDDPTPNTPAVKLSKSSDNLAPADSKDSLVSKTSARIGLKLADVSANNSSSNSDISSSILALVNTGKLIEIPASDIISIFNNQSSLAFPQILPIDNVLLVDMRDTPSFQENHISNSINPSFPKLVTQRFKKKIGLNSFNLSNFLARPQCLARFQSWKEKSGNKAIIVYDDTMSLDYNSDAWSFATFLADGGLFPPSTRVSVLKGGFDAIPQSFAKSLFIHQIDQEGQLVNSIKDNLVLENYSFKSEESTPQATVAGTTTSSTMGDSKEQTPIAPPKQTRSLSIDVKLSSAKKESPSKKPMLITIAQSTLRECAEEGTVDSTTTASPTDQAQPQEPYNQITKNIMIGSDYYPNLPDGPAHLKEIGVTHILNMANDVAVAPTLIQSGFFTIKWIPVADNTEVDMDDALQTAISFINDAISSSPNSIVFVHCKAGRSRSVSAVIGYLVSKENHTLKTSYALIRKMRKGVSPNLGFMAALMKVEKEVHGVNTQTSELYQ